MVTGFVRSLFVLSVAALASAAAGHTQDAKQLFEEGVRLLQQSKDGEALAKFKAAVAANPSMAEAYDLWKETDNRVWAALMVKSDEFAKVATHMLRLAQVERKRASADADAIQALVAKALSDSYEDRVQADLALASNHRDYAVPFLLDALGDADSNDAQTYAILACEQIGRAATVPLVAALATENALLRRNIAAALLYIGDDRALPALKRLAEGDEDPSVREVAQKAVVKVGGMGIPSSVQLYLQHSHDYLTGRRLHEDDILDGVWSYAGGKLVHRKVPPTVFPLELAKDAAYGALAVDPNNQAGLVALTRAYLAERAVVASALAGNAGEEAMKDLAGSLGEIGITVLAGGPSVVRTAFEENVAEQMIPAAVEAMHALAKLHDAQPLIGSLRNPDKRIRYGAAIALGRMDAKLETAERDDVVAVLGQAVLEQSVRVVKFVDPDPGNQKVAVAATSESAGLIVDATGKTSEALADIARFPPDVFVMNEKLDSFLVDAVLLFIADRPQLQNTKIILVSKDPNGAREIYGDKIQGYIEAPVTATALKNRIDTVLEGVPLDRNRAEADRVAAEAAAALARLDAATFPVANASAQLVKAAARGEHVAIAALDALGHAGSVGDLAAIVQVMNDRKDRTKIAAAAAAACGRIMARAGNPDQATVEALVALARDRAVDATIRAAAVGSLGEAPILPATRARLFRELRVDPKTGGEG